MESKEHEERFELFASCKNCIFLTFRKIRPEKKAHPWFINEKDILFSPPVKVRQDGGTPYFSLQPKSKEGSRPTFHYLYMKPPIHKNPGDPGSLPQGPEDVYRPPMSSTGYCKKAPTEIQVLRRSVTEPRTSRAGSQIRPRAGWG